MRYKNMLPQIVFYRHISPSFYTVSAEVCVARNMLSQIVFTDIYPLFLIQLCNQFLDMRRKESYADADYFLLPYILLFLYS